MLQSNSPQASIVDITFSHPGRNSHRVGVVAGSIAGEPGPDGDRRVRQCREWPRRVEDLPTFGICLDDTVESSNGSTERVGSIATDGDQYVVAQ